MVIPRALTRVGSRGKSSARKEVTTMAQVQHISRGFERERGGADRHPGPEKNSKADRRADSKDTAADSRDK